MEFDTQGNPLPPDTTRNVKRAAKRKKALIDKLIKEREKKLMHEILLMRTRKNAKKIVEESSSESEEDLEPLCSKDEEKGTESEREFEPFYSTVDEEHSDSEANSVERNKPLKKIIVRSISKIEKPVKIVENCDNGSKQSASWTQNINEVDDYKEKSSESIEIPKPVKEIIIKKEKKLKKPMTIEKNCNKEQSGSVSQKVFDVGSGQDGKSETQVLFSSH